MTIWQAAKRKLVEPQKDRIQRQIEQGPGHGHDIFLRARRKHVRQ
jgi:hypothetical protein